MNSDFEKYLRFAENTPFDTFGAKIDHYYFCFTFPKYTPRPFDNMFYNGLVPKDPRISVLINFKFLELSEMARTWIFF